MNLIAAVDQKWGLGCNNKLLFHISADLKRFKKLTSGNIVIMGRKTFLSLPGQRPLPDRVNIVLTDNLRFRPENTEVCASLPKLAELLADKYRSYDSRRVFVIGGASVYRQLLPYCEKAYITQVAAAVVADCYLPDLDAADDWELTERGELQQEKVAFRFVTYENRKSGCGECKTRPEQIVN